jgi:2-methylcitrate dehydratase PrpD
MLNRETVLDESEFAVGLRYEDLPANVVAYAKQCILDSPGCGIFGAPTSVFSIAICRRLRGRALTDNLRSAS